MSLIFLNGQLIPEDEARIPFNDRGLLFGDGLFTTLRIREGKAECLQLHLERLNGQCHLLKIQPPEISEDSIAELIRANRAEKGIWRMKIVVTGGLSQVLSLPERQGTVIIFLNPYQNPVEPASLCLYPETIQRPLSRLKTLSYLDRLLVKEYALENGFQDAIVATHDGYWLECAFSNLFWRQGNRLFTPSTNHSLLAGITLNLVLQAAHKMGMAVEQVSARMEDLPLDAQLYQCSSLIGIHPISRVEAKDFPRDEEFEKRLNAGYREIMKAK